MDMLCGWLWWRRGDTKSAPGDEDRLGHSERELWEIFRDRLPDVPVVEVDVVDDSEMVRRCLPPL
jgi:hypothetical protein